MNELLENAPACRYCLEPMTFQSREPLSYYCPGCREWLVNGKEPERKSVTGHIGTFLKDESGQDIVEYSLLLVLIGAAAIFVLTTMGVSIQGVINRINTKLNELPIE